MSQSTYTRLAWVLAICMACAYFFVPLNKIRLGLDLKGGVHYELEVQTHEAVQRDLEETRELLDDALEEQKVPDTSVMLDGGEIRIRGAGGSALRAPIGRLTGYAVTALDGETVLRPKAEYVQSLKIQASQRALKIIENRINQFGVVEPEITSAGPDGSRIIVELPGVTEADKDRIKGLLSTPGRLELRMLANTERTLFLSEQEGKDAFGGAIPESWELVPEPLKEAKAPGGTSQPEAAKGGPVRRWVLLERKVQFDGTAITDARGHLSDLGQHEVHFTLNPVGAEANARVTAIAAKDKRSFAFVLDKKIVSVLSAQEKIIGNAVRVTGHFTQEDTEDFALKLRSGALRAGMKVLEERVVGPSLGQDRFARGSGPPWSDSASSSRSWCSATAGRA